ncbi:MAG: non-ribosomal peptide synthetase [Burkholderiales bacterium]
MMRASPTEALQGFEAYRLSPQQRAVWLAQQAGGGNAFRARCMLFLDGDLDIHALKRAFERMIIRHQALRMGFRLLPGMAVPLQVIGQGGAAWQTNDLCEFSPQTQAAKLEAFFEQEHCRDPVFGDTPLRLSLFTLSRDRHALLISLSALCADSATLRNLVSEIGRTYAGVLQDDGEFVDTVPYLQFSEWQNQLFETEGAEREAGREFWRGSMCPPKLPFEKRREEPSSFELNSFALVLDDAALERRYDPAIFVLTVWQILLFRLTGEEDICVNVHCEGRPYEELRDALGLFAKDLPIRCQLTAGLTFDDVLRECERGLNDAREWQDYWEPRLEVTQDAIAFEYEEPVAPYWAGGVTFSLARQYCCSDRYKLKLAITKSAGQMLHTVFYYNRKAFDRDTVSRISDCFAALLQSAIRDPDCAISRLSILRPRDRQRLLADLSRTRTDPIDLKCVHHRFEEQVARTPNDIALVCGEQRLTYADLNRRANRVAHRLRRLGVKPDTCIALYVGRSTEALVGVLGILKAGGAYVPLNPEYPRSRLAYLLGDIRAAVLLTEQSLLVAPPDFAGEVICVDDGHTADESESDPPPVATLEHLVYVLYTSGTTGTPKGVAVTHRSLSNYTQFIYAKLGLEHKRLAFATVSTLSADLGNTCIFPSLVSGGCLHVLTYDVATDAALFAEYVARYPIDVLKIVPSHLKTLQDSEAAILPREYLILGGEASSWKLIERIAERGTCRVINHYGPTETTVGSLTFDVDDGRPPAATVPIGRPIANAEVYVLDPHRNPVPIGVAAELYIGGVGLARGYLNRPELTAEKFVSNPFSEDASTRLYRTGDLVRYLPDGHIEFLGRSDDQVKIRGFRIELGEIENALTEHPQLRENAVIARELESGDKQLIAYVVARGETAPTSQELRGFLKDKLPEYMMPAGFVMLKALPLTRNGKLDRNALPDVDHVRSDKDDTFTAPRNPVEVELA